jgi:opacity protein-like surface antigen
MCGLALTSLAVVPAVASAQAATRPVRFGVTAGGTLPIGDFSDAADFGFHLGALVDYKFAGTPFGLRVDGQWHRNELKSELFDDVDLGGASVDGHSTIIFGAASLTLEPTAPTSTVVPYGIAGVGVYNTKATFSVEGEDFSDSETKPGFNIGGGFKFKLSGFDAFVEARFHTVNSTGGSTNFIPISFGLVF